MLTNFNHKRKTGNSGTHDVVRLSSSMQPLNPLRAMDANVMKLHLETQLILQYCRVRKGSNWSKPAIIRCPL